jgi:enoyl-CoA hydratase/carnithine racemase
VPDFIEITRDGTVTTITFNRPAARNALNYEMMAEISAALAACNDDPNCRAIVLTGSGDKAFCAGMDLSVTQALNENTAGDWMARTHAFFQSIRMLDKPCVAAVNGVAAGAGYQVALLSDLRVGHAGVRMGQTEINVGLASILGAHIMEPHLGFSRTVELTLSGRLMSGLECHELGLFHDLVPEAEVRDAAVAAARSLGEKPPVAMRLTKQRFREVTQAGLDDAFEAGARLQAEAYRSGEPQRVMAEFFAKRRGG